MEPYNTHSLSKIHVLCWLAQEFSWFCRGQDVFILNTGFGNEEDQKRVKELLHVEKNPEPDDSSK